jgi:hypothetical protein
MNKFTRLLLTCLCLSVAVLGTSPAFAAKKKKAKSSKSSKSSKSIKSIKIKQESGSAENAKDRERRLLRECRGQVNAGACAGLTRG